MLGVSKNADNREIRKAFKKLALKYHPDKNSEDDAHEKFLKINKAYETLKDEETRKKYDLFGEDGLDGSNSKPKVFKIINVDCLMNLKLYIFFVSINRGIIIMMILEFTTMTKKLSLWILPTSEGKNAEEIFSI